jgi:hypothetical protein
LQGPESDGSGVLKGIGCPSHSGAMRSIEPEIWRSGPDCRPSRDAARIEREGFQKYGIPGSPLRGAPE